jgi:hypothetical protein
LGENFRLHDRVQAMITLKIAYRRLSDDEKVRLSRAELEQERRLKLAEIDRKLEGKWSIGNEVLVDGRWIDRRNIGSL